MDVEDIPTLELDSPLEKAGPRGGKYYRRVATGDAKRPWRYYYSEAEYKQAHGDAAHIGGEDEAHAKQHRRAKSLIESGNNAVQHMQPHELLSAARGTMKAKDLKTANALSEQLLHNLTHGPYHNAVAEGDYQMRQAWHKLNPGSDRKELNSAIDRGRGIVKRPPAKLEEGHPTSPLPSSAWSQKDDVYDARSSASRRAAKSEGPMRLIVSTEAFLSKAGEHGFHKYIGRTAKAGGGWTYEYEHPTEGKTEKDPLEHFNSVHRTLHTGTTKGKTPHAEAAVHSLRALVQHGRDLKPKDRKPIIEAVQHHLKAARTHAQNMANYAQRDRSGEHYRSPKDEEKRISSKDVNEARGIRDNLETAVRMIKEGHQTKEQKAAGEAKKAAGAEKRSAKKADELKSKIAEYAHHPFLSQTSKRMYNAHLLEHKERFGSHPAGHEPAGQAPAKEPAKEEAPSEAELARTLREKREAAGQQTMDFDKSMNYEESDMMESTPELREQLRMMMLQEDPMAKGLYAFEPPYQKTEMNKIPEEYLAAYLDAFIEEAYEHEKREKGHDEHGVSMGISQPGAAGNGGIGGDEASYWAQWVMNELITYCGKNTNLLAACKKLNANKEYVADRLRAMGLVKPAFSSSEVHGDFMEGYMFSEQQTAAGIGKSMSRDLIVTEDEMRKSVDRVHDVFPQAEQMVKLEDDGVNPVQMLANVHNARFHLMEDFFGLDLGMKTAKR